MTAWLRRIRWSAIPIVVVSLVVATLLVELAKPVDRHDQLVPTRMGAWGRFGSGIEVRVNEVRTGTTLLKTNGNPEGISQGRFIVVNLTLRADSTQRGGARLVLRTRDGIDHQSDAPPYQAGFATTSDMVFKVPGDQVQGAVLLVKLGRTISVLDRTIAVDLGLTPDVVGRMPRYATVKLGEEQREAFR